MDALNAMRIKDGNYDVQLKRGVQQTGYVTTTKDLSVSSSTSMEARHEQHLQAVLLDPFERRLVSLSTNVFDECRPGWVHGRLQGIRALATESKVISNVHKCPGLEISLGSSHGGREGGCGEPKLNNQGLE